MCGGPGAGGLGPVFAILEPARVLQPSGLLARNGRRVLWASCLLPHSERAYAWKLHVRDSSLHTAPQLLANGFGAGVLDFRDENGL